LPSTSTPTAGIAQHRPIRQRREKSRPPARQTSASAQSSAPTGIDPAHPPHLAQRGPVSTAPPRVPRLGRSQCPTPLRTRTAGETQRCRGRRSCRARCNNMTRSGCKSAGCEECRKSDKYSVRRLSRPPLIYSRRHLEHVLSDYVRHYNEACPHRGRQLSTPLPRHPRPTTHRRDQQAPSLAASSRCVTGLPEVNSQSSASAFNALAVDPWVR